MKPKPWDKLPASVRAAAVGIAGRAIISELCGREIRSVRLGDDGQGVFRFFGDAAEEWVEAATVSAEPAARDWYFRDDDTGNRSSADALAKSFSDVFDEIGCAIHPVAAHLATGETLFRSVFLHMVEIQAGAFEDKAAVQLLKAKCERVGRDIISKRRRPA